MAHLMPILWILSWHAKAVFQLISRRYSLQIWAVFHNKVNATSFAQAMTYVILNFQLWSFQSFPFVNHMTIIILLDSTPVIFNYSVRIFFLPSSISMFLFISGRTLVQVIVQLIMHKNMQWLISLSFPFICKAMLIKASIYGDILALFFSLKRTLWQIRLLMIDIPVFHVCTCQ